MANKQLPVGSFLEIDTAQLQALMDTLRASGYRTVGPRIADGAIVYADLTSIDQLPVGYIDRQDGGYVSFGEIGRRRLLRLCRRAALAQEFFVSST